MGKLKNGLHGPVTGKVGNVVYSTWNDQNVVKSAPVRTAPFTEKEEINHWRFAKAQDWIRPIGSFLKIGFRNHTPTSKGMNAAKSYLMKNAFPKEGWNSRIIPSLVMVSAGTLALPDDIQVSIDESALLTFTWNPVSGQDQAPLDQVMLMAYNVEAEDARISLGGNFRKSGTASLDLSHSTPGEHHLYLAFVAHDQSRQSNSVYLGEVTV